MNQKWIGIGRIGQDAESYVLPSGTQRLKFSLAIDDSYQQNGEWKDRTYWIPIEVGLPSLVQSYNGRLLKGTLIWVEGKVCTYTYQDSQGQNRTGFKVEASGLRIIPTGGHSSHGGYQPPQSGGYQPPQGGSGVPQSGGYQPPNQQRPPQGGGFAPQNQDDIPF